MKFLSIAFFLVITFFNSEAQIIKSKLDIVAGLSAREYFHLGARYQYAEIAQLGIYLGNDLELNSGEVIRTFCIDNQVHFGKHSYYSNRPVWFARQGYTFLKNNTADQEIVKYSYIDLSIGRDFPINDWFGLNVDMGMLVQFRENSNKAALNTFLRTLPLARVQLYYSF